ncbi:MAG: SPFH domain-containing protein [Erysipelotrichaceae bacterium]|jgi:membrane protease subunit (stomatin/prohibitin family)|nr:SPFH domain-containing protein [Erysipelotrichaceae bacterium]
MGLLKVIEWKDENKEVIVHRFDYNKSKDFIARGSALTVRESQVAIFVDKGRLADVFLPGYYKLDTENVPILTKLMSWKYGFESPFKSDIYFVNTKQFINQKWGTSNPLLVRDKDFGPIQIRGFGTYSFRVNDAYIFMKELASTNSTYDVSDIRDYLKSLIVTAIADTVAESGLPILDLAANLRELGDLVVKATKAEFSQIGLEISKINIENFSLPKELEDAMMRNTSLGMRRQNLDVELELSRIEALKEAAKNPGAAGTMMGAGIGWGMGQSFGRDISQSANRDAQEKEVMLICPGCGKQIKANSKFCSECGYKIVTVCPACGKTVAPGTKFCGDCGTKL